MPTPRRCLVEVHIAYDGECSVSLLSVAQRVGAVLKHDDTDASTSVVARAFQRPTHRSPAPPISDEFLRMMACLADPTVTLWRHGRPVICDCIDGRERNERLLFTCSWYGAPRSARARHAVEPPYGPVQRPRKSDQNQNRKLVYVNLLP